MGKMNASFLSLLDEAVEFHGHLCAGQIIGVRLAMLGLCELGIAEPKGKDRKRLIVFVEIDRCATDAIMTVTGCRVGKRNMKIMDYGKMAATFIDVQTDRAVRIISLQTARAKAAERYPALPKSEAQMKAYREFDDSDLFSVQDVTVSMRPEDLPGPPLGNQTCAMCKETILDCRELRKNGRVLCQPCATQTTYYDSVALSRQPLPRQSSVKEGRI